MLFDSGVRLDNEGLRVEAGSVWYVCHRLDYMDGKLPRFSAHNIYKYNIEFKILILIDFGI